MQAQIKVETNWDFIFQFTVNHKLSTVHHFVSNSETYKLEESFSIFPINTCNTDKKSKFTLSYLDLLVCFFNYFISDCHFLKLASITIIPVIPLHSWADSVSNLLWSYFSTSLFGYGDWNPLEKCLSLTQSSYVTYTAQTICRKNYFLNRLRINGSLGM